MDKKELRKLGFKVTNEFFQENSFNRYDCGNDIFPIINSIKGYCSDVLQKEWMANNVIKLPYTLNAINPASLLVNEDKYNNGTIEFFCHSSLSTKEMDRMIYLISTSIEEFIEKHRDGLRKYDPGIDFDNFSINAILNGLIGTEYLANNLSLIKVLLIRKLAYKPVYIGSRVDRKYLQNGREIVFYPSYCKQYGHMLISEIIEVNCAGRIERMAYFIIPNIELDNNGEIYIYPLIGIKRFVSYKRLFAVQAGNSDTHSLLVFDGSFYYSPRIAYREKKDKSGKGVTMVGDDWKLYNYLEKFKAIEFKDILGFVNGEDNQNLYLVYSNRLGLSSRMSSGVPGCDKLDIFNYLINNIGGLEPVKPVEEISYKKQTGGLTNTDQIILNKTLFRNDINIIELLVIHPPESMLYRDVLFLINDDKLFKKDSGLVKCGDGLFLLNTGDGKALKLLVHSVPSIEGIEIRSDDETAEERFGKIKNEIGEFTSGIIIALIELENMGKYDAKSIIRKALDSNGIINQFIDSKSGINTNKIASGLRDLLNDIGLGNLNQKLGTNEVIYTLHKTSKVNFICRLDNKAIEVKIPSVKDDYIHIANIYPYLSQINAKTKDAENLDSIAIAAFLEDITNETRDVIVILDNGEAKYNNVFPNLSTDILAKLKSLVKEFITTDLLGHQEVIQTKKGKISQGTGIYEIEDGVYISIGDKGQDKTNLEASKIRMWNNNHGKISIGATITYKDRVAYEIRMHKNTNNHELCSLVHKLRLATTMHMHLNRCLTTDYILGLDKHLRVYQEGC
jgi:hypothetical protein